MFDSPVVHAHNILTTDCKSWFLNLCNIPLIWLCTSHSAIQPLACNPRVTQQLDGCACLPHGLRYELLKGHARRAQVLLVRHGMQTLLHLISQGTQGVTSQRCEGSQEGCRMQKSAEQAPAGWLLKSQTQKQMVRLRDQRMGCKLLLNK